MQRFAVGIWTQRSVSKLEANLSIFCNSYAPSHSVRFCNLYHVLLDRAFVMLSVSTNAYAIGCVAPSTTWRRLGTFGAPEATVSRYIRERASLHITQSTPKTPVLLGGGVGVI